VREISRGGGDLQFEVSLLPGMPAGEFRDRVAVALEGGEERGAVIIPVYANLSGTCRLEPRILSFGLVTGSGVREVKAELVNLVPEPLEVREVRSNHPAFSASVEQDGRRRFIRVVLRPEDLRDSAAAAIEIITGRQGEEKKILPVHAILPPRR